MATELFSGVVEAGTPEDVTVTNLGKFGVIWRDGPLEIAMIEANSSAIVPINNAEAHGALVGDMVGVTLRLTNKGTADVNATVYEE